MLRPTMCLISLFAATMASAQAELVLEKEKDYRLVYKGKPTDVVFNMLSPLRDKPRVETKEWNGVLFGTVTYKGPEFYGGKMQMSFVKDGERTSIFHNSISDGPISMQARPGNWVPTGIAQYYKDGEFVNIGPTSWAWLEEDGSVKGFYYRTPDGKPTDVVLGIIPKDVTLQWFVWKDGKRRLTVREAAMDRAAKR